jgi:peptidyl-dipeptidase Dcp
MRRWIAVFLAFACIAPALAQTAPAPADNPLLTEWTTPFAVPPFAAIRPEHFMPAFREAMARERAEVDAIAAAAEPPTFANTIAALDAAGEHLDRVGAVFSNLDSAETNEALQAVAREVAPLQAAHRDATLLDEKLFARVKAVWDARATPALEPDQARLLELTYKRFVRGGALLHGDARQRMRDINAELAKLSVAFGEAMLKETNGYKLVIERREDLAGLSERMVKSGAEAAAKAGMPGKWVYTLHGPSLWPFLEQSANRELRRRIFTAYTTKGAHGDANDTGRILARTAALRAERARLLGYATHADFVLEENMAKDPAGVYGLLNRLWAPAKAVAAREAEAMQAMIDAEGGGFQLAPWDWFYYAEKVRKARYDLDEGELRPYFRMEAVRDGAFAVASRLYGITFTPRPDLPVYNPEVAAFEVKDADGAHLAIFFADYHPRPGKRSGAWSSRFRGARVRDGKAVRPVVVNVGNFSRPAGDTPALLSLDEVQTLFHELGHALHSMLSRVRYAGVAAVPRDFVELPSQIMENWALHPDVLPAYARHWKTGEPIPPALVEKLVAAQKFNQGFATVEYLAACLLDMEWHTLTGPCEAEPAAFERIVLARIGMPAEIVPRYRSTYFQHIFAGGYSSGYYSYVWSEVLDSDAFEAFKEKGLFDPATARSFRTNILEKGGSEEAMAMYVRFRGRPPAVEPLLAKRGLM